MPLVSRNANRFGVVALGVVGVLVAAPAFAARPATTVAVVRGTSRAEVGSGHSVSGGGRGRVQLAARPKLPAVPPTTRAADVPPDGSVVVRTSGGHRRSPQSRPTSWVTPSAAVRLERFVERPGVAGPSVSAGLFHEAHAPPSPATDVAGRLA